MGFVSWAYIQTHTMDWLGPTHSGLPLNWYNYGWPCRDEQRKQREEVSGWSEWCEEDLKETCVGTWGVWECAWEWAGSSPSVTVHSRVKMMTCNSCCCHGNTRVGSTMVTPKTPETTERVRVWDNVFLLLWGHFCTICPVLIPSKRKAGVGLWWQTEICTH